MRALLVSVTTLLILACAGGKGQDDADTAANGPEGDADTDADTDADPTWSPVVVDFDDLDGLVNVDEAYARHLTFEMDGSVGMYAWNSFYHSAPYCAYATTSAGNLGSEADIRVVFTRPVRGLSFYIGGDTAAGAIAHVTVTAEGGDGEADMVADGNYGTTEQVDLSAWEGVTELLIHDMADSQGVTYDDFVFEQED
jgi:hypothetical protein